MPKRQSYRLFYFIFSIAEIGWPECHVLVYGRCNYLAVRVLEDKSHAFAQHPSVMHYRTWIG